MKKVQLLIMSLFLFAVAASAQAYEGTAQFDKKKQRSLMIDYAYPPEAVENAIVERMSKLGYKPKEEKGIFNKDKGFLVFKNVYITDISPDAMDYMVKVEKKSRKASDESTVYVIMMNGDANALDRLDSYDVGRSKTFLNNMIPDIEASNLELQIKAQEEVVSKAEKKLSGLQRDKDDLEKKIATNIKDQDNTQKDIESQKAALESLRGKRKPSL